MGQSPERDIYEKLWDDAVLAFDRNAVRLDAFLKNRQSNKRRSVTLLARPNAEVRDAVKMFLNEVAAIASQQYFYQPAEFHSTILSVIPGTEFWQAPFEKMPEYFAVLDEVLKNRPAFSISFRGVTASPEAVLIQGFPEGNALTQLRNDLRAALVRHGLGENLDRRYKVVAAHLTVVRFSTPMANWKLLKDFLAANRERKFGTSRIDSLQLVESDWYLSDATARVLREYSLA